MKRVIGKRIYDTKKAELIHEWDNGFYGGDFRSCQESLYRTGNEQYFICGSGGARSKYAEYTGNGASGGSGIQLVSKDEAIKWLEEHRGENALMEHFAEEIEEG